MNNYSQNIEKATLNRINVHTNKIYTQEFVCDLMSNLNTEYVYDNNTYIIYLNTNNVYSIDYIKEYISTYLKKLLPNKYTLNNDIQYGLFFNVLQLDNNKFNILL